MKESFQFAPTVSTAVLKHSGFPSGLQDRAVEEIVANTMARVNPLELDVDASQHVLAAVNE